jgi:hypothetical protein
MIEDEECSVQLRIETKEKIVETRFECDDRVCRGEASADE